MPTAIGLYLFLRYTPSKGGEAQGLSDMPAKVLNDRLRLNARRDVRPSFEPQKSITPLALLTYTVCRGQTPRKQESNWQSELLSAVV